MEKNPPTDENKEIEENRGKQSNHLIIEVMESLNEQLKSHANKKIEQITNVSIYKVPDFIKGTNVEAFEPKVVSFGPYHHGKQHLLPMELEKLEAFHNFTTNNELNAESIVERVSTILEDLLGSYDKIEGKWKQNPGKFLQLMVVDGCFMLQFFYNCPTSIRNINANIMRDMLLLENQVPLILLMELHSFTTTQHRVFSKDLTSLICDSLGIEGDKLTLKQCYHILDMYKSSLLHPMIDLKDWSGNSNNKFSFFHPMIFKIRPITRLQDAGIKFKKSNSKSLTNVSFKQGVLALPPLIVDNDTEMQLSNVMAFETLHLEAGSKVTSFIILMNNLINGDRDVALLDYENIVLNLLGTDQDAANMFSRLGSVVVLDMDLHMVVIYCMINEHCRRPWNMWCTRWKHYYFRNPWALISFYATILGFLLLIVQFTFQLLDYYVKP